MTMAARSQGRWSATNGISLAIQACHAPTVGALPGLPTRARLRRSISRSSDWTQIAASVRWALSRRADAFDDEQRAARRYQDRALALMLVPPRRPEHHRLPRTHRNQDALISAGQTSRSGNAAMPRHRCAPQLILLPRPPAAPLAWSSRWSCVRPPPARLGGQWRSPCSGRVASDWR